MMCDTIEQCGSHFLVSKNRSIFIGLVYLNCTPVCFIWCPGPESNYFYFQLVIYRCRRFVVVSWSTESFGLPFGP
jgi:hypothetical protein